jgi:hypothetical protein
MTTAEVNPMFRHAGFLWVALSAVSASAGPVAVTINGNFGAPQSGSSIFDNQNYVIQFLIPEDASPAATTCCLAQTSATYDVNAHMAIPGAGVSLDNAVQVQYNSQLPLGQWMNIFSFTGLPVGDFMILTPFQIATGDLWNGLAGALGTPEITPHNAAPGTGTWHVELNTPNQGPMPIAVYANGPVTLSAAQVPGAQIPEPAPVSLLAAALVAFGLLRSRTVRRLF